MKTQDDLALKLHTAPDGEIWFADGTRGPVASGCGVQEFSKSLSVKQKPLVRLLGCHVNAPLLLAVYPRCCKYKGLEVASPRACPTAAARDDPELALFYARQWNVAPSLGGWHSVTERDYHSYQLADQVQTAQHPTVPALHTLEKHPAWPALNFIENISPVWTSQLLADVLDPRWYIDLQHPNRVAKLRAYLGWDGGPHDDASAYADALCRRRYAALAAWRGPGEPDSAAREKPGNFLWRIYHAAGGDRRGNARATQKFLAYLNYTWLAAVAPAAVFDPRSFFKTESELQAYAAHIGTCSREV